MFKNYLYKELISKLIYMLYKKSYKSTLRKRKPKSTRKPSKTLVKTIKNVIHKQTETKFSMITSNTNILFNGVLNVPGDLMFLVPNIPQGTDEAQRIGDQVRAQYIHIKGHINIPIAYTNTTSETRLGVRVMVGYPKRFPSQSDAYTNYASWLPSLLKSNTTNVAFLGTVTSLYLPINHEAFTCLYDKIFYLDIPYVTSTTTSTSQNLRGSVAFINKIIKLKNKLFRYDDTSPSNQPNNYGLSMLIGYAHLDGSAADTTSTAINLTYVATMAYEDS